MAKVLLVDDEELVRKVVRVVLEAEGYTVLEAGEGERAVAVAGEERPAVVVLDLMLPGEDGAETCRRIKALDPAIQVLVLTSLPPEEAEREAASAGADGFMVKPFSSLELLRRVGELVGT